MLVTGKNGIGVKEMPHVASHATPMHVMLFVSKYNLASPTRDVTIPNSNVFAFVICFAPHRKRTQKMNPEEGEKTV